MGVLSGRTALITGGSRGIGLAVAKTFAQAGAQVAVTGRNVGSLRKAIAEIGAGALAVTGDVADIEHHVSVFAGNFRSFRRS